MYKRKTDILRIYGMTGYMCVLGDDGMGENSEKLQEKEIDLRVVFSVLRKNIIPLLLVTVIFGACFYAYSSWFVTKSYSASAILIVNNKNKDNTVINSTEITAAQNLADVYSIIIKSDAVLQPVLTDDNLRNTYAKHSSMTYEKLRNSISVSNVNSTQVISIKMTDTDPSYARDVVDCIVDKAPEIIKDKVEVGSVKEISASKIDNNGRPVSPNSTRNAVIGALIGFVITLAVVFIRELTNNTFKSEEDIVNTLNIPLLGIIPAIDAKEFNKNV